MISSVITCSLQSGWGNVYSYTLYDALGRITEVGQISASSAMTDASAKNDASLQSWFTANTAKRGEITQTGYDFAFGTSPTYPNGVLYDAELNQQHLRNRVSYTQLIDTAADTYPASATYYSYDVHGNVDTLLQDFGIRDGRANMMNITDNRFKKLVYDYDLISGKVNQVSYQPGQPDAYYHRYVYDAENRLTDVYSGRDSVMLLLFPEREAHYNYYLHGPLARIELGQLRVQGLDYAYTLQGWLKGVNPVMGGTLANGTDTAEAFPVSQDVYGFSLHYYPGDYRAIGYSAASTNLLTSLSTNAAPLYNGNIAAMAVNIPQLGNPKVYNYHYDQLNRIVAMDAYDGLNPHTGTFSPVHLDDYRERVSYDPNGNILTYNRHGDASRIPMDSMTYNYKPNTNQLDQVADAAADAAPGDYSKYNDIKQGQTAGNYQYDATGNLISDASEAITGITWNVYGKIASLTKSGQTVHYVYDASGNRIMKQTSTNTTAYVRDATGNVLSVYAKPASGALVQSEMHLYGSSRLGMATQHLAPDTTVTLAADFVSGIKSIFTRGEKLFELSNHLGNVLATIDDRRIQIDSNSDGTTDHYLAYVATASDYYSFGMQIPGRTYMAGNGYRYGLNGKEKLNEIEGEGNAYDFGARIQGPRLGGRFFSVDPHAASYPHASPYSFVENNPISRIDPDGKDWIVSTTKNKNGSETVHITLTAAVLNSSANSKLNMGTFASSLSSQVKKSYSTSYTRFDIVGYQIMGGGLDGVPGVKVPIYKAVPVNVVVDVQVRTIIKASDAKSNEHLIEIEDASKLPGVYARASDIGGTKVFVNESKVSNMMNGNDNNTLVHELGHTFGLRHIDKKEETFFETFLWGSNPQYYDPKKQKANANNAMFSGGSPYMNDKASTEINGEQIEIGKKKYNEGDLNKH